MSRVHFRLVMVATNGTAVSLASIVFMDGVGDNEGLDRWTRLAEKHWLKSTHVKRVNPDLIKNDIWDTLVHDGFDFRSLLALENLQLLERYVNREAS